MNDFQTKLYNELMALVESNEAFFFNDWELEEFRFRNFNYRLASYSDFLLPSALECRGHMFEIDEDGNPLRLASFAPQKFFNLYENPFTMDLDLSDVVEIADKADGSLITTYMADGILQVKTKGSLTSDQAMNANAFLRLYEHADFRAEITTLEMMGYTVIMEWCAPDNRIVLPYMDAHLKVLCIRNRNNGSYLEHDEINFTFPEILNRWTKIITVDDNMTNEDFIASVDDMQGVEGVVFRMANGQRVKKKGLWYLALHHTKDSITVPRRLFEAVLEEATDDMRSLFHDDPLAIKMIADMEVFVEQKYNHMVDTVERFYERNKHMERKDFAILGKEELDGLFFGLAMNKYVGRAVDYKAFLKGKWKALGLKDEKVEFESESGDGVFTDTNGDKVAFISECE